MEDLLNRSALLNQAILSTVDHPPADSSSRLLASMDAALLSLEHADALRTLMAGDMASSVAASAEGSAAAQRNVCRVSSAR